MPRRRRTAREAAAARRARGQARVDRRGAPLDGWPHPDARRDRGRHAPVPSHDSGRGIGGAARQAGARFADVLPYLNERGRSIAVMQSNSSFTVGGSLSVNCHGWQHDRPPIASTVRSFRLMRADGSVVRCSRDENAELFSLALGGYGMFGIILDVDLETVPNETYTLDRYFADASGFRAAFEEHGARTDVGMCYGRLDVSPDHFLESAILNVFVRAPAAPTPAPPLAEPSIPYLKRLVFRGQVGSAYGKRLRWMLERRVDEMLASGGTVWRNQLLAEEVGIYEGRSASSTDILHEYFVPRDRFADFVADMRGIIPARNGDLLNVTIRMVERDDDAFLRYADQPMFSLVLLFAQPRTPDGDASMEGLTRELIDAAYARGGRYYLPYRLAATKKQLDACYPQARAFFDAKRRYDPGELFQSKFYARYGR
ncbi:MAG: FAD-binding oxidoreductase [Acidobacteriota bacterium]